MEVFVDGEWGTVCDDVFTDNLDGVVVCRQLGYTGILGVHSGMFREGEGDIWLDSVGCRGDEEYLTACSHAGFGVTNCHHNEDVGVVCGESHDHYCGVISVDLASATV